MPPLVSVAPRQVQHEVEYDDPEPEPSFPVAFALLGISLVALLLYFLWEGQASAAKPMGQTSQDSSTFPIWVQSSVPFKDIRSRYAYTCYTYDHICIHTHPMYNST